MFAQLPYQLQERAHVDMSYGLLKRQKRKRIPCSEVDSFKTLLKRAKAKEDSQREVEKQSDDKTRLNVGTINEKFNKKLRPRCSYCKNFGHSEVDCRKKKPGRMTTPATQTETTSVSVQPHLGI